MNTRLLVNLGLLALCIALGWFALRGDTPAPTLPGVALTSLSTDRIDTIRIERDGRTPASLQRDAGVWRVKEPIDALADAFRVQALLELARARSNSGFRATGNDLTQYGLQPPRASVQFDSTILFIGDTDPVAGQRYIMSGDQVHVVEDNWFSQIFGDGIAWLDPRPLPAGAVLRRIDLHDGSLPTVRWQRQDEHWQRTPANADANTLSTRQRGAALADAWQRARALSVQRRDSALHWSGQVVVSFDAPPQSVTSAADAAQTIAFAVARTDEALFLARPDLGVQFRFLSRQGEALLDLTSPP